MVDRSKPRIGVYVCRCGGNIDNSVDTKKVHGSARELEDVVMIRTVDLACSPASMAKMAEEAKAKSLDRVVIAACSPKLYLAEFQETLAPLGIKGCMVEMCNIREQCAWVHFEDKGTATKKAEDMLRMSHARLRLQKDTEKANVSEVNKDRCTGCGICEGVCNFNAIRLAPDKDYEGKRRANVNMNACEGCGACVAACPTAALDQTCFSNQQILAEIEACLSDKGSEIRVLVFSCHWCSYTAADVAGLKRMSMPPEFRVIRTMCSARVDPEWVLKAISMGADGVMVMAGQPGRCHYEIGNLRTRKRMLLLHKFLDQMGFDPDRFHISYIDSERPDLYVRTLTEYVDRIKELGPNPVIIPEKDAPKRLEMPWLDIKPPKKWNEGLDL